jgi:hypothetical protein
VKGAKGNLMKLKIGTWNMNYRSHRKTNKDAWDFLAEVIAPDIFLAQESKPEDKIGFNGNIWHPIANRQWGSGVFTKTYPIKERVFVSHFMPKPVAGILLNVLGSAL